MRKKEKIIVYINFDRGYLDVNEIDFIRFINFGAIISD